MLRPGPPRIFQPNRAFVTEDEPVAARTLRLMISRPIDGGLHEDIDIHLPNTPPEVITFRRLNED